MRLYCIANGRRYISAVKESKDSDTDIVITVNGTKYYIPKKVLSTDKATPIFYRKTNENEYVLQDANYSWMVVKHKEHITIKVTYNGNIYTVNPNDDDIIIPIEVGGTLQNIEAIPDMGYRTDGYSGSLPIVFTTPNKFVNEINVGNAILKKAFITIPATENQRIELRINGTLYTSSTVEQTIQVDYLSVITANVIADEGYRAGELSPRTPLTVNKDRIDFIISKATEKGVVVTFINQPNVKAIVFADIDTSSNGKIVIPAGETMSIERPKGTKMTVHYVADTGYFYNGSNYSVDIIFNEDKEITSNGATNTGFGTSFSVYCYDISNYSDNAGGLYYGQEIQIRTVSYNDLIAEDGIDVLHFNKDTAPKINGYSFVGTRLNNKGWLSCRYTKTECQYNREDYTRKIVLWYVKNTEKGTDAQHFKDIDDFGSYYIINTTNCIDTEATTIAPNKNFGGDFGTVKPFYTQQLLKISKLFGPRYYVDLDPRSYLGKDGVDYTLNYEDTIAGEYYDGYPIALYIDGSSRYYIYLTTVSSLPIWLFNQVRRLKGACDTYPLLDTSNVKDMSYMFGSTLIGGGENPFHPGFYVYSSDNLARFSNWLSRLSSLPIYDTSKVENMSNMFAGCTRFVDAPKLYDTSKVENMSNMFAECVKLENFPQKEFNTSNVRNTKGMFRNCVALTTIPEMDTSNVEDMSYMFYGCEKLTTIPKLSTANVENMGAMFYKCHSLTTIPYLNTHKVKDMGGMFYDCKELTAIPELNTSNVECMAQMFDNCRKLTAIPEMDTHLVRDMQFMFSDCIALTTIPQLDTSNVENMRSMFWDCLITAIPEMDTHRVKNMSEIFRGCKKLTTIPQLDTSNVEDMGGMFWDCTSLTTIPYLDTSNVEYMGGMFCGCEKLTTIPQLVTSKNWTCTNMFSGCTSLTTIPPLDTRNVKIMEYMFEDCTSLTTIPPLDTSKVNTFYRTFYNCINLTGTITLDMQTTQPSTYGTPYSFVRDMIRNTPKAYFKFINVPNDMVQYFTPEILGGSNFEVVNVIEPINRKPYWED